MSGFTKVGHLFCVNSSPAHPLGRVFDRYVLNFAPVNQDGCPREGSSLYNINRKICRKQSRYSFVSVLPQNQSNLNEENRYNVSDAAGGNHERPRDSIPA